MRQLVNAARRLTVTAPGRIIAAADIGEDFGGNATRKSAMQEWALGLEYWAEQELASATGEPLLQSVLPEVEKTLIRVALKKARGHRQEAAKLLGCGRNTLTRKIKSFDID